jgi:hypothetical protein
MKLCSGAMTSNRDISIVQQSDFTPDFTWIVIGYKICVGR